MRKAIATKKRVGHSMSVTGQTILLKAEIIASIALRNLVAFPTFTAHGAEITDRHRLSSVTESVVLPPEARWNAMTDYPAAIQLSAIQQLRCPKCRARMKLARVSSGPIGFELRTFDCAKCDRVEQIVVALDDPMKSDAVGWFSGELRPPK
jgi:hypothetical protein